MFYHAGRLDHKSTNTLAVLYKAGRLDPKRQTRWRCSITLAVLAKKKKHAGGVLSRWPSWSKKEKHAGGITSGWPSCIPPAVIPVIDIPDIATNVSTCIGASGSGQRNGVVFVLTHDYTNPEHKTSLVEVPELHRAVVGVGVTGPPNECKPTVCGPAAAPHSTRPLSRCHVTCTRAALEVESVESGAAEAAGRDTAAAEGEEDEEEEEGEGEGEFLKYNRS